MDSSQKDIGVRYNNDFPTDTVSQICFNNYLDQKVIACSCWDGKLKLYKLSLQYQQGFLDQVKQVEYEQPMLSIAWFDNSKIFIGCGDGSLKAYDFNGNQGLTNIGMLNSPICKLFWVKELNAICVLTYDKRLTLWSINQQQNLTLEKQLKHTPFTADMVDSLLLVGMSEEKYILQDLQHIQNQNDFYYQDSPLSLYSQITSVCIDPQKKKIGFGASDGRANITNITPSYMNKTYQVQVEMTWKAQKVDANLNSYGINAYKGQGLFAVNALGFNPRYDKFVYTCGSDGSTVFWDYDVKNKILNFDYNKQPVTAAALDNMGYHLAYALGYDWHQGIENVNKWVPRIYMHNIPDNETSYKKFIKQ